MAEKGSTILGLDIGGTKTAIVEGTREAEILQRHELLTEAHLPFAETFPRIAAVANGVIETAQTAGRKVRAISVSILGPL